MSRKFTYEIRYVVEHVEDNVDMPTLNVRTLAEAMALNFPPSLKVNVTFAHLIDSEHTRQKPYNELQRVPAPRRRFSETVDAFLDDLVRAGAIVDDEQEDDSNE